MRVLLKLLVLNHQVVSRGRMTGYLAIEGKRGDSYWF
jgi:hypothetical protein